MRNAKKWESVTHTQEKKLTETACEKAQKSNLRDKNFKAAIINMFKN